MFAVITAAVAVLSASGRALLMSRVESDVSPSTTASTRRGPGLGQPLRSESFGNWKVALRSWNMDAQQGSDRHVLRMTITNVSDELRTWSAYEQVALRYEVASPGGEINRYVRSPDRGGGPVDIDPRESLRAEYTWDLAACLRNVVLKVRSPTHEGDRTEVLFVSPLPMDCGSSFVG